MCPDHELISVYLDGELPSVWKEKMESHLSSCPSCRKRLESYQDLSARLASLSTSMPISEETSAAQNRVWQALQRDATSERRAANPRPFGALWRRTVSVPLPAAAAAAVMFVALTYMLVFPTPQTAKMPDMPIVSQTDFDSPDFGPIVNMDDVLQYLGSQDSSDVLVIRLPESRSFSSNGEPALIRATDYSRHAENRRER
jgi:hypothetical protein